MYARSIKGVAVVVTTLRWTQFAAPRKIPVLVTTCRKLEEKRPVQYPSEKCIFDVSCDIMYSLNRHCDAHASICSNMIIAIEFSHFLLNQ